MIRHALLSAAALLALAGVVSAEAWEVGCDAGGCRMGQVVTVDGKVVARVMILKLQGTEIVEVLYPLGVSMLAPVFLHVDDKTGFDIRTAACKQNGCYGVVPDAEGAVAAFKAGTAMKLRFTGFDDGKTYFYPFTLNGFTAAYDRYAKGGE